MLVEGALVEGAVVKDSRLLSLDIRLRSSTALSMLWLASTNRRHLVYLGEGIYSLVICSSEKGSPRAEPEPGPQPVLEGDRNRLLICGVVDEYQPSVTCAKEAGVGLGD